MINCYRWQDFLGVMRSADSSNSQKVLQVDKIWAVSVFFLTNNCFLSFKAFQVFDREGLGVVDAEELREVT